MKLYLLLYKTLLHRKYRDYLERAGGDVDMCHETLLHGTFYEEYRVYGFARKTEAERRSYLTDAVRDRLCRHVNSRQGERLVANKYLTYCRLKPFYHRHLWLLTDKQAIAGAAAYGLRQGKLVVKPVDNCGGRGVQLIQALEEEDWRRLLESHRGQLAEECIVQDSRLARWNPSTVNTVRVNTFHRNGEVTLFTAFLLTGRAGRFVNNGAQGGLFASIDTDSGVIFTDGYDEEGIAHHAHPDSGTPYRGSLFPAGRSLSTCANTWPRRCPR